MTDKKLKNDQEEVTDQTVNIENNTIPPADEKTETENKHKSHHKAKKDKSNEKIEELEAKISEMTDRHLRLQAEFDNFRKRTLKEKSELIKSGGEQVLSNILPVIDDFDRAVETTVNIAADDPIKIGLMLIYSKFGEFLKQNNVTEIQAIENDFNVDLHYAVTKIPAPNEDLKGKVVDVIQKGYLLNDKVIRHAKVVIGE